MTIGIDLGGTSIRVGLVDNGKIVSMESQSSKAGSDAQQVLELMAGMIARQMNPQVEGIGIGVPSVVDIERGIVYDAVNIPSWKEVHLKDFLEERFHVPVHVNNDANCFALGEVIHGEARGAHSAVGITLGTGVGATLVIDGRLYCGANTGAGEIGNIPYLDRDYEYYCSSRYFKGLGSDGRTMEERALAGDPEALKAWEDFGRNIGELVKLAMFAYDPEVIVLGGSIAKGFGLFKDSMYAQMQDFPYKKSLERISIKTSTLPNISLLGASALCSAKN